ncbi:hypothetical protein DICPUDRAFT_83148 [Dictyostelium purpureum]|uniref:Uncharacterized protein n=1 Tax=Dictyostelium purpureum TaxID=5786 RepID=F0ZYP0_DICPU|nr:uncharacterized protein DICPUDRAFT_83148 [Dictyostelium purpureum]EGC30931.1 hypothetical protein DICPUDRAFT_83148 [Dictyostelium purpureum]|eukprot:XP_003292534.1 hypothetical protein DICPUDRAFT_83148 [Dictyostelium purpureum]
MDYTFITFLQIFSIFCLIALLVECKKIKNQLQQQLQQQVQQQLQQKLQQQLKQKQPVQQQNINNIEASSTNIVSLENPESSSSPFSSSSSSSPSPSSSPELKTNYSSEQDEIKSVPEESDKSLTLIGEEFKESEYTYGQSHTHIHYHLHVHLHGHIHIHVQENDFSEEQYSSFSNDSTEPEDKNFSDIEGSRDFSSYKDNSYSSDNEQESSSFSDIEGYSDSSANIGNIGNIGNFSMKKRSEGSTDLDDFEFETTQLFNENGECKAVMANGLQDPCCKEFISEDENSPSVLSEEKAENSEDILKLVDVVEVPKSSFIEDLETLIEDFVKLNLG